MPSQVDDFIAACDHIVTLNRTHDVNFSHIRAVYDAAAAILGDDLAGCSGHDNTPAADLWQLRADYIDAHAAAHTILATDADVDHHINDTLPALDAARDALVTAITRNTVNE